MAEYIKVPAGVYDMVTRCMEQEFPDHVAIRYVAEDGKTVVEKKYREYAQDIRRMTAYLKAEVPDIKGRRIVLLSRNCYEFCVASFGIILAGGVLVTLNQKKTWDELEYELGLVEPALILNDGIDYGCRAELEAAYGPKLRPMDCYKDTAPGELTNCVGHDDLMMLMFTSGTTGRSKGVMLSERNMCASLHTYSEVAENWITNRLPAGQKLPLSHMTLLPLFHMACFVCVMSYPPAGWALNLCGDIRDFYRDLGLMHSDVMASAPMLVETIYNDMKRGRVSRLNGLWDLCCSTTASPASDFTKSRFILSSTRFTFAASSANTMISADLGFFLSRMTTYNSPLDLASLANSRNLSWGMVKNFIARCSFNIRSRLVFPLVFFWSFITATISTARFFAMLPLIRKVCSMPSMEYRTI